MLIHETLSSGFSTPITTFEHGRPVFLLRSLLEYDWARDYQQRPGTYVVDMVSMVFDAYLRLEDAQGNQLAEDDDSGGDLNARIVHKSAQTGRYRIYATTFRANDTGAYTLNEIPR